MIWRKFKYVINNFRSIWSHLCSYKTFQKDRTHFLKSTFFRNLKFGHSTLYYFFYMITILWHLLQSYFDAEVPHFSVSPPSPTSFLSQSSFSLFYYFQLTLLFYRLIHFIFCLTLISSIQLGRNLGLYLITLRMPIWWILQMLDYLASMFCVIWKATHI